MDIKKLAPWNWFKKEDNGSGHAVPVKPGKNEQFYALSPFHSEVDRLFDEFFDGFGLSPLGSGLRMPEGMAGGMLKPKLDLSAADKEYTVSVEVPGVSEKDVSLELTRDTLTIRGEKKQEKEEKNNSFYRLERAYGSFQRILSLPEDADKDHIKANFKNGVLKIAIPRVKAAGRQAKQIEIKAA